ncbi:PadR family transcriptional regulator [Sphingomonas sp. A2-49]|uniref:PadR family transcriptional regulator n=1 Tax=Sphingomonas sp. A2-49 TaxID=1391375 RepID=UPI0021CECC66|nr:PadR family transcriptional regulator [Sphingomonas sp. A2-49]MCU6452883.1 PadR family transcriptional regulator [Sphingomonas sp. A2-49]
MFGQMHGRHGRHGGERGCGPRGPRGGWDQFAEAFAGRWDEAQRGGGGRRRMFDGSELRLVLLRLIADEPRHGYELIKAIEELTGGAYAPSPGMVYPALTMLNDMELIEEQASEGARKRFAITAPGQAHLAEHAEAVAALVARLTGLGVERNRGDHAPVRRAMHNLRHAVQNRVMHGDLDEDALYRIVALIDEAAQKVERLK